jgi:protein subunit release factor B
MSETFVSDTKKAELLARMAALSLREADLVETFILGSGSGGQKLNKTASCVRIQHPASGFEVKCQRSRSRELNRYLARRQLCEMLEARRDGRASEKRQAEERIRRQKRRRSRRQKERMLEGKKQRSECKAMRRTPTGD